MLVEASTQARATRAHHCQQHERASVNILARASYKYLIMEPKLPFFTLLELHELN